MKRTDIWDKHKAKVREMAKKAAQRNRRIRRGRGRSSR